MIFQCNPKANYIANQEEIDAAIKRVLDSGWYILGQEVEAFEADFAKYCNVPHCISCANGTDALELAMRAMKIGYGDQVVTVANTAVATVAAIERTGATPLFVDINPITYTMCPDALNKLLKGCADDIKAVIAVHLFGHPADIENIKTVAEQYGKLLIEDCAQAHGAMINDNKVGSFGDAAAFSFYPTKNLGALGDGGAVISNNAELAARLKAIRQYGWEERYISSCQGVNSRLDELQAAVLRVKLRYLDQDNVKRQQIAAIYNQELSNIANITLPQEMMGFSHVYHQYVIQATERDQLKDFLQSNGIGTAVHYPVLIHKQPAYSSYSNIKLPVTEQLNGNILSLPMFSELDRNSVETVVNIIKKFYQRSSS